MTDPRLATLETIVDGAAIELFNQALARVMENTDDLNTDHKPKRMIRLDFTFKVDDSRRAGHVLLECKTVLAPVKGVASQIYIGRHKGELVMVEPLRQEELFTEPAGKPEAVAVQPGA